MPLEDREIEVLEWLQDTCCDLRCVDIPTGGDDADVGWIVIEHHMAEPKERTIGYGNTPLEAINDAQAAALKRITGTDK